jgi:outer membrane lipoprotein carrier protein
MSLLSASRSVVVLLALTGLFSSPGRADLVSDYFADLDSVQGDFSQTVVDSAGETVQDSQGQVWIQRPGRFRWDYRTPYHQLIVADGKRLWTYDEDLEQATVKDLDAALSSTPAVLLSGYRPLSEVVTWEPEPGNDAYSWFRLRPRESDTSVETVRLGFEGKALALIEVVDGFGNHTRIRFSNLRRNQKLDDSLFSLKLPEGTDVIGDTP